MLVDAQDIDALLIGALYGELTPADEARLAAHLESHPTDRTALDDLTHARSVVRESRIFEIQSEPPQAVSALLLQEAARRAPKRVTAPSESEGWFHRFVRSFMSHPAMAAAAMLVVVVGVAGTLYMRHGDDQFANERAPVAASQLEQKEQAAPAAAAVPEAPHTLAMGSAAAAGSGSAYNADLAEDQTLRDKGNSRDSKGDGDELKKKDVQLDAHAHIGTSHTTPAHDGLVVHTPAMPLPRELPAKNADATAKIASADDAERRQEVSMAPGNAPKDPNAGYAQAPQTPSPSPTTAANAAPPPPAAPVQQRGRTVDKTPEASNGAAAGGGESTLLAWAKDQHARVQAFVKAGQCQAAAKIALDISAKAPDYYAANVATDRMVKACATYINDARDKEAEKSQKARAAKRVNANEPAPATQDLK